jgi:class 3 adenylate cyclase
MHQAVERENRSSAEPLGLRVAISCGEATSEDGNHLGDPVIEAARLCAVAEGGQIVVSEWIKAMAGCRSDHAFERLGPLELMGRPSPSNRSRPPGSPWPIDPKDPRQPDPPARSASAPSACRERLGPPSLCPSVTV